jgi:hypothetical protein
MLLDLSQGAQKFVEDCEVCCRPLLVSFDTKAGELGEFHARVEN